MKRIPPILSVLIRSSKGSIYALTIEPNDDAMLGFFLELLFAREFDADESKRQCGKKVSAVDGLILKVFVSKIEILFPVIFSEIVFSCAKVIADVADLDRLVGCRHFHGFESF